MASARSRLVKSKNPAIRDRKGAKKWRFVLCESGRILRRMDKKKISKQRRKIKKLYAKEIKGEVLQGTCNQSMQSYMANARRGDTYHVRSKVAKYYYEISGGRLS